MNRPESRPHRSRGTNWYLLGFLAIAGYFLFLEHRAHIIPYLPFLLVLACPLMHLLMHRGHRTHARDENDGHEHDSAGERHSCCNHPHTQEGHDREPEHPVLSDNPTKYPDRPA